jgi:hypothetical protein
MLPGEVQNPVHLLSVQRLRKNVEATKVYDFGPQALVGQPGRYDDWRRDGQRRRYLQNIFPIAIRKVALADDNARMAAMQMESHFQAVPYTMCRPREPIEKRFAAAVILNRTDDQ